MGYELRQQKNKQNIFLVDMSTELNPFWSDISIRGIEKVLQQGGKILIINNKKSYAQGILCNQCGHIMECDHCNITLAYHQTPAHYFAMCHICKKQYAIPNTCPQCHSQNFNHYGRGIEQIAEWFTTNYKQKCHMITSETTNSLKKIKTSIEKMKQTKITIGTSLAIQEAKGIQIDLIIMTNADQPLNVPDYEAHAKTFYQIYDCIKSHTRTPNMIIQSRKHDHPSIRYACRQDISGFLQRDKDFRRQNNYPPQGDIAVIMYKNEIEEKVFNTTNKLHQELLYIKNKLAKKQIEIYATPPLIYKMYDKYRYHIIIKGKSIRTFLEYAYQELHIQKRGFKIDRQAKELI